MAFDPLSLVGGLLGAFASGSSSGGSSQVKKDPWEAAQPWLKGLLTQGQQMQDYYQKNPFSTQQKGAYENSSAANNQYNQSFGPGMMNWATSMMNNGITLPDLPALPGLMSVGGGKVSYDGTYQPKVSLKSATAPTWDATGYKPTTFDWSQQPFASSTGAKTISDVMASNDTGTDPNSEYVDQLPQEIKDWIKWVQEYANQSGNLVGGG